MTTNERTIETIVSDIKENVSRYNLSTNAADKAQLDVTLKALESEYNELSLLNAWTGFVAAENPMVAFAKAYTYEVIGHKDADQPTVKNGVKLTVRTRIVEEGKTRMLNVADFVQWTEGRGASVAHSKYWVKAIADARDAVIEQWRGFMTSKGDTRVVSIGKMKKALQGMVDALVFVEGSKGGNALVVKSDVAKAVFALCNQRRDGLKGSIMSASVWKKLQMDVLHAVVDGKEFIISYGDEDDKLVPAKPDEAQPATAESK